MKLTWIALAASALSTTLALGLVWLLGEPTFLGGFLIAVGCVAAATLFATALVPAPSEMKSDPVPYVETEFLGGLSHEIRTPLNGILGLTQILLRMRPGAREREYLEMIKTSGDSLLRLLNDLLDYSKIRTGKLRLVSETFSMRRLVRQTVTTVAPQAHLQNIEMVYWVDPAVPDVVVSDPSRLRQVLANLLVNAVKFTEEGEIFVEVTAESSSGSTFPVRFSVKDTGIGVPEEHRARIFEAFVQGRNAPGDEQAGVGLGLTISAELVEGMGGSLSLESEPGKGSTFSFVLPVERAGESSGSESVPTPEALVGLKALIVDDSPAHREVLVRQMKAWDVEAVACGDRVSALEAIDEALATNAPFSLLLLDSRIPRADLWSFVHEINQRAAIPGVLMVFSHEHVDPDELKAHGILGQLAKPIAPSHLSRAVEIIRRGATVDNPEDVQTNGMDRLILGGLRVLVAEDHPVNRTVVARMLEKCGSQIVTAKDGADAVACFETQRFDVVLLDLEMPEKDGLEVARAIREGESGTSDRVPIIALTAHARERDRARCLEAGMNGFLSKPFREEELVSEIQSVLTLGRRAPSKPGRLVFDRDSAISRANGDPELLAELAALFLDETPRTMEAMAAAIEEGDLELVEKLSHRLKGALLTLAARSAASVALELEERAAAGAVEECRGVNERLEKELSDLRRELAALVPREKAH